MGTIVGELVGSGVGGSVGADDGGVVGTRVGAGVGADDGAAVGTAEIVGAEVGWKTISPFSTHHVCSSSLAAPVNAWEMLVSAPPVTPPPSARISTVRFAAAARSSNEKCVVRQLPPLRAAPTFSSVSTHWYDVFDVGSTSTRPVRFVWYSSQAWSAMARLSSQQSPPAHALLQHAALHSPAAQSRHAVLYATWPASLKPLSVGAWQHPSVATAAAQSAAEVVPTCAA